MKKLTTALLIGTVAVSSFFAGTSANVVNAGAKGKTIPLNKAIPIDDIAVCYTSKDGSLVFEVTDYGNQYDDPRNRSYKSIKKEINSYYKSVKETEYGVLVTYKDGTGYFIEK